MDGGNKLEKHTLYFSDKCPDTTVFVEELDRQGYEYDSVNITESMKNLKQFLKLRDSRPQFEDRKLWNMVGVPVLHLKNNNFIFELNDLKGVSCTLTETD